MSLVVIPFLEEDPQVVADTLTVAATHDRIDEVVGIYGDRSTHALVARKMDGKVHLRPDKRIGSLRPGKGDATNTGLAYFLEETDHDRLHFFDADIRTFDATWIDKAESAADAGHEAVRHYYPRSATDGMITWMVTKTGFALLWPHTPLAGIKQPLAGELLFTRSAAARLWADDRVRMQSDWGIDTLYTFASVQMGLSIAEVYEGAGKDHALYGPLSDLRLMSVECLAALQSLIGNEIPIRLDHTIEPAHGSSPAVTGRIAYNVAATIDQLGEPLTGDEVELLDLFSDPIAKGLAGLQHWPCFTFMNEETWWEALMVFFAGFRLGEQAWESLFFRAFACRVLDYTTTVALGDHAMAMSYLDGMVDDARQWASDSN